MYNKKKCGSVQLPYEIPMKMWASYIAEILWPMFYNGNTTIVGTLPCDEYLKKIETTRIPVDSDIWNDNALACSDVAALYFKYPGISLIPHLYVNLDAYIEFKQNSGLVNLCPVAIVVHLMRSLAHILVIHQEHLDVVEEYYKNYLIKHAHAIRDSKNGGCDELNRSIPTQTLFIRCRSKYHIK